MRTIKINNTNFKYLGSRSMKFTVDLTPGQAFQKKIAISDAWIMITSLTAWTTDLNGTTALTLYGTADREASWNVKQNTYLNGALSTSQTTTDPYIFRLNTTAFPQRIAFKENRAINMDEEKLTIFSDTSASARKIYVTLSFLALEPIEATPSHAKISKINENYYRNLDYKGVLLSGSIANSTIKTQQLFTENAHINLQHMTAWAPVDNKIDLKMAHENIQIAQLDIETKIDNATPTKTTLVADYNTHVIVPKRPISLEYPIVMMQDWAIGGFKIKLENQDTSNAQVATVECGMNRARNLSPTDVVQNGEKAAVVDLSTNFWKLS